MNGKDDENGRALYRARFPDLVDIVDDDGALGYLFLTGGRLVVTQHASLDGRVYRPPSRQQLPWRLARADRVLDAYEGDNDAALFEDLVEYHRAISQLPSEDHYVLLAAWTAHTYLQERWQYSPILCLYAVPERGKTRTGRGIVSAAYRGIETETLREAAILRWTENLGAAIFFDVHDLWRRAERVGGDDILLKRYERGATVMRVLSPGKGPFEDSRYFQVYGPTVIATNEPVHKILDTRCITITMSQADGRYFDNIQPDDGLALRERLLAFRARHLEAALPDFHKPAPGRLGDILQPLGVVVRVMSPTHQDALLHVVDGFQARRLTEKSSTLEARIILAVDSLTPKVRGGRLLVKDVAARINQGRPERTHLSEERLGPALAALGFEKKRTRSGMAIIHDDEKLAVLKRDYGLAEAQEESSGILTRVGQLVRGQR